MNAGDVVGLRSKRGRWDEWHLHRSTRHGYGSGHHPCRLAGTGGPAPPAVSLPTPPRRRMQAGLANSAGPASRLDALIEPSTRGSPTNPLRWTCLSTRRLAKQLHRQGFAASASMVRRLLRQMGYSLQANRKTEEGNDHPDRNAQFEHINRRVPASNDAVSRWSRWIPRRRNWSGNSENSGREWRPQVVGREEVDAKDFPDKKLGKAVPMGSTTWIGMRAGSASESTMTRPSSP